MRGLKVRRKFLGRSTLLEIRRLAHAAFDMDGIRAGGTAVIAFGTANRRERDGCRSADRSPDYELVPEGMRPRAMAVGAMAVNHVACPLAASHLTAPVSCVFK
jgi:hypothetical protein